MRDALQQPQLVQRVGQMLLGALLRVLRQAQLPLQVQPLVLVLVLCVPQLRSSSSSPSSD
jgi:hypothetical protein